MRNGNPAEEERLVGIELGGVLELAEGPPHFFDDLHLLERGVLRIRSGAHRIHHRLACSFGRDPRLFAGGARRLSRGPELLLLLSDGLERVSMVVAELARLFRQTPELFRFVPGSLGQPAVLLSVVAAVDGRGLRRSGVVWAGADGLVYGVHRPQRINCAGGAMF